MLYQIKFKKKETSFLLVENTLPLEDESDSHLYEITRVAERQPLVDGTSFQVIPEETNINGTVTAICKKCTRKGMKVKRSFWSHSKRVRGGEELNNFIEYQELKSSKETVDGVNTSSSTSKNIVSTSSRKLSYCRQEFEQDIVDSIIDSFLSLDIIENEKFLNHI